MNRQTQFTTPIPIVCLDPLEHTDDHPYCGDETCPCSEELYAEVERQEQAYLDAFTQGPKRRQSVRTCLYCQQDYTCWVSPDEPSDFCSDQCERALNALYEVQ